MWSNIIRNNNVVDINRSVNHINYKAGIGCVNKSVWIHVL